MLVAAAMTLMGVACAPVAQANRQPGLIADMNHRSWPVSSGAPADIWDMGQDALGFIWLATGSGLVRFDGQRFQRFTPLNGESFASTDMTALLVVSPSELWVGTTTGIVTHIKEGHVTNHRVDASTDNAMVFSLARTQDGGLWAVTGQQVVRVQGSQFETIGETWGLARNSHAWWLAVDAQGTAWLATDGGLMFLRKGAHRFESTGVPVGWYAVLALSPSGTLWISDATYGTRALPGLTADHVPASLRRPLDKTRAPNIPATRLAFDRQGALWGTVTRAGRKNGVFRIAAPWLEATGAPVSPLTADWYHASDGLNSVNAVPVLIDREGDVWVGTNFGLHRFHANSFRTLTIPGMPPNMMWMSQSPNGSLGVLQDGCLYALVHAAPIRKTCVFPPSNQYELFLKDDGAYTYTYEGFFSWDESSAISERPFPGGLTRGSIRATATDTHGDVWVAARDDKTSGIYRQDGETWKAASLTANRQDANVVAITFDDRGNAWTGTSGGEVMRWDGEALNTYGRGEGLDVGPIEAISVHNGAVMVAGETGVARLVRGRFQSLSMGRLGLPGPVTGALRSRQGDLWLNTSRGIVRLARAEAEAAFANADHSPPYSLYGSDDGVNGIALMHPTASTIFEDTEGRLWFANNQGVSWVNPSLMSASAVAPQATIESIVVDGKAYTAGQPLTLRAPTQTVAFQFTAASFLSPENVKFKYRLSGVNSAWQTPTTDRQATFVNVSPGHYLFEVLAANSNGVWGERPATVAFDIEPRFYQMRRFQVLGALTALVCLLMVSASHYRNAIARIRDRLEAQHAERGRIARHLHDTLIQGVQSLILQFHAISDQIPPNASLRDVASRAIDRADQVMEEVRDQVQDMRTHEHVTLDVALAFAETGRDLSDIWPATFRLLVTGEKRVLDPAVSEEVFLIGREALINAFRHAHANVVELHLMYGAKEFVVCCNDDGQGISPEVLAAGRRAGHWGLPGMRERSEAIKAELDICAAESSGTQVTLAVPSRIAYTTGRHIWWDGLITLLTLGREGRSVRRG